MTCNHDLSMLVGTADGIRCKGCGQVFKSIPKQAAIEVKPAEDKPATKTAPAKKAPAKKTTTTTKGGKK